MMEAMGAAISGLEAQQTMLNTTASNLANVDTIGYKSQGTSFVDALSQTIAGGSSQTAQNAGSDPEQVGLGVSVGAIENNMSQGADQSTGIATDLAIQGQGFFQVANFLLCERRHERRAADRRRRRSHRVRDDGHQQPSIDPTTIAYTRAGNFKVSSQGYLVTRAASRARPVHPRHLGVRELELQHGRRDPDPDRRHRCRDQLHRRGDVQLQQHPVHRRVPADGDVQQQRRSLAGR